MLALKACTTNLQDAKPSKHNKARPYIVLENECLATAACCQSVGEAWGDLEGSVPCTTPISVTAKKNGVGDQLTAMRVAVV
jgi:hypothetical protein